MKLKPIHLIAALLGLVTSSVHGASPKPCFTADAASRMVNKEVCVSAHVYDVVELPDGTRFLDICSPETPDEGCTLTLVSLDQDREMVGELRKYRDMNVQVRGIVRSLHGMAAVIISHPRQFAGGPPRFRPDPRLARGFSAADGRPAIDDPNLHAQRAPRRFMVKSDRLLNTRK